MNNGKMKSAAKKAGAGAMVGMAGKAAKTAKGAGATRQKAMPERTMVMNAAKNKKAMANDSSGRKTGGGFMGGGMVKGGYK